MESSLNTTFEMGWLLLLFACILIIWIIYSQIKDLIRFNNEILSIKQSLNVRLEKGEISKAEYQELINIINH